MDLEEVLMKHKGMILSGVAIAMLVGVTVGNSQQKSTKAAVQQDAANTKHAPNVAWSQTTKRDSTSVTHFSPARRVPGRKIFTLTF